MRNQTSTAKTFSILSFFIAASAFCFVVVGPSGLETAKASPQSKSSLSKITNPRIYSVPNKRIGVGYPSPYSTSRGSSYSRGTGPRVDFRRPTSSPSYSRNPSFKSSTNNRSRSSGGISFSPFSYSNPYGLRGFGTSTYFRPTYGTSLNRSRTFIGSGFYSTGGYSPYAVPNYGSQYDYNPYSAGYPPQPGLSSAEAAARTQLFNNNTQPSSTTITNQFYARIPTSAAARSFQSRAEQTFKSGDYEQAASLAEKAVVLDSINGKAKLFASQASFAVGNYATAISHLDLATRSLAKDQWSYVVKNFKEFYGQNDYVSQTDQLSQKIAVQPTADHYALRGYHYGSLGYVDAATVDFNQALKLNRNHSLTKRLLPVLGLAPQPLSPDDIQAPVPGGTINGFIPINGPSSRSSDGIIRLVPQFTDEELQNAVPEPVPDLTGANLPTFEIEIERAPSVIDNTDTNGN